MRTFEELERLWREAPPAPRTRGTVRLLCLRKGNGVHECPPRAIVTRERGLEGDRWYAGGAGDPKRQLTLMSAHAAAILAADHAPLEQAGDNVLVELDLSEHALPVGARLRAGGATLEISPAPHLGCAKFRARFGEDALRWVNLEANRALRLRGVNCTVIDGGEIAVGDPIEPTR